MLGTTGRRVQSESFPEALRADVSALLDSGCDYEDGFLRSVSLFFAYHNSGKLPDKAHPESILSQSAAEVRPYMTDSAVSILNYLYDNVLVYIFRYALWHYNSSGLILPSHSLPRFLELAYTSGSKYMHQFRLAVWPLLGNRGKWLVDTLNLGGERFSDASHPLKLRMFVAMRKAGLKGSVQQLQIIWGSISNKQKKDFLSVFMNVHSWDLDFLWQVFGEGGPCGMMALNLMLRHPASKPVEHYMQVLDQSLRIDGRRHCDFSDIADREKLAEMGIDGKVSDDANLPEFLKKLPENEVVVFKLIQAVPLIFWMRKMDCDAAAAARFLDVNPAFRIGFDFKSVISRFRDVEWAVEYCILRGVFCADFLPFMDAESLERVAQHCDLDGSFRINEKICGLADNYSPWLPEFSMAVVNHIIHTRNFENTSATAQFLAVKLSRQCDMAIQSYIADNYGNDMVVSFFQLLAKYRKLVAQITR